MKFDDLEDEAVEDRFGGEIDISEDLYDNPILSDPVKAIDLVGRVIGQQWNKNANPGIKAENLKAFKRLWLDNLRDLESLELPGHIEIYRQVMALCEKLRDSSLASILRGKTILGIGGQFSSGKSAFINAVVGLADLLPQEQSPTTSIPTFVTKSENQRCLLTSMNGMMTQDVSANEINALSHTFHDKYGISFSAFIDSCIIFSPDFLISPKIVLLDTPGYSKPDDLERAFTLSDRERALEQLKRADRLIWLIHQENGSIPAEDIKFINDINPEEPILIVVTHADQVGDENMNAIIESIREMSSSLSCEIYGITGYSAPSSCEYAGKHIISDFLADVEKKASGKSDVVKQFAILEERIENALKSAENEEVSRVKELKKYIANTKEILAMRSLAILLERARNRLAKLRKSIKAQPEAKLERQAKLKNIIEVEK